MSFTDFLLNPCKMFSGEPDSSSRESSSSSGSSGYSSISPLLCKNSFKPLKTYDYLKPPVSPLNTCDYLKPTLCLSTGCDECGRTIGHASYCSKNPLNQVKLFDYPKETEIRLDLDSGPKFDFGKSLREARKKELDFQDMLKTLNPGKWVNVQNPVIGTCRNCGHRGFVSDPSIYLYNL